MIERAIDDLIDSHLLQEPAPGRYRYHDLVMGFALSLENAEDSAAEKDQALGRLIDFSIHAVDRADRMIHPARPRLDVRPAASEIRLPGWRDRQEAESWLMTEHLALLATARYAMANGHPRRAAVLSHVMAGFLESGGFAAQAEELHGHAIRYWREAGEHRAEARALIDLGTVYHQTSRYEQAMAVLHSALAVARRLDDVPAAAEALIQIGTVHWDRGQLDRGGGGCGLWWWGGGWCGGVCGSVW